MKDNSDQMDKAIKDKFEGHEVHVPSNLWKSIESKLPPEKGDERNVSFFKNLFTITVIILCTFSIAAYLFYSDSKRTDILSLQFNSNKSSIAAKHTDHTTNHSNEKNRLNSSYIHLNDECELQTPDTNVPNSIGTKSDLQAANTNMHTISSSSVNYLNQQHSPQRKHSQAEGHNGAKQYFENHENRRAAKYSSSNSNSSIKEKSAEAHRMNQYGSLNTNESNKNRLADLNRSAENKSTEFNSTTKSDNASIKKSVEGNKNYTSASITSEQSITNTSSTEETTFSSTNNIDSVTEDHDERNSAIHSDSIPAISSTSNQGFVSENSNIDHSTDILQNTSQTEFNKNKAIEDTSLSTHLNTSALTYTASSMSEEDAHTNLSKTESGSSELINQPSVSNTLNPDSENGTKKLKSSGINENQNIFENNFYTTDKTDTAHTRTHTTGINAFSAKLDSAVENKHIDSSFIKTNSETVDASATEEEKKRSVFLSKCSFDGFLTPALAYMHTVPTINAEDTSTFFTNNKNVYNKPGTGITLGIRMNYVLTRKIEIGIGFQYSSMSQASMLTQKNLDSSYYTYQGYNNVDSTYDSTHQKVIYTNHFVKTDSTANNTYSSHTQKYIDKYQSFSIPIHIAYGYSITDRLSILARTSFLINYKTYSVTYLSRSETSISAYHSHKNISLGGSFSIGAYYAFSKQCSVFAEPIINYYFSNVFEKKAPIKQTQLMLGIQTGIRLSF